MVFWNTNISTTCNWQGVLCENNRVTILLLGSSLFGTLPSNTLSKLTFLRSLSLLLNHLSGPLPSDLSRLSQLQNLFLQGNRFSGVVPDVLFSLTSAVESCLEQFSGEITVGKKIRGY